jgi:hypothetical protein
MKISKLDWFFNKLDYLNVLRAAENMEEKSKDNKYYAFRFDNWHNDRYYHFIKVLKLDLIYIVGTTKEFLISSIERGYGLYCGGGTEIYFFLTDAGKKLLNDNRRFLLW